MKRELGRQEMQMLAYLQMRGKQTVRTGELTNPLKLSSEQEQELFRRMERGGLITRVRKGLYLVPLKLPLGGAWTPDETLVINTLIEDRQGRFQITGPNAFNRYGFSDQIPTRLYAYNNRISGDRSVGNVNLTLIKVADERLGDTEVIKTPEGQIATYSSRKRALIDAVYDWARFNTLPQAYQWLQKELKSNSVRASEIVETTLRFGDIGTLRRIGVLLEQNGIREDLLKKIERKLKPSSSYIPWIPTRPKRGKTSKRWGVIINE
jgi:predicted transcriptional regulator of viral defense system